MVDAVKPAKESNEERMFRKLRQTISELACVLRESLEQRKTEFDWLRSTAGLATKCDLKETERRLTDAIAKNAQITPGIVAAADRLGSSLDVLDAIVPDKQT